MRSDFDFDVWRELAERDPQAFFRERGRYIGSLIDDCTNDRGRLLALQAQIDGMRAAAGTPERAIANLVRVMGDHLKVLASQASRLRQEADALRRLLRG